jgi:hypothetical protein
VGLSVFGLQQAAMWGWHNAVIWLCIAAGGSLLVVFVGVEHGTASPLMNVHMFANRQFLADNIILSIAMMAFNPRSPNCRAAAAPSRTFRCSSAPTSQTPHALSCTPWR